MTAAAAVNDIKTNEKNLNSATLLYVKNNKKLKNKKKNINTIFVHLTLEIFFRKNTMAMIIKIFDTKFLLELEKTTLFHNFHRVLNLI